MKKMFLTSDMGCSIKVEGIRHSQAINNVNGIVDQIKRMLVGNRKIIFFVSNPEDYEKNDYYGRLVFESFRKTGFFFNSEVLIDYRFKGDLAEEIKTADLVFFAGGKTETQIEFFKKINLKEILNDFQGVIIGQSAGAMNLANEVISPPEEEEEIGKNYKWPGLGKTDINIEPHFVLDVVDELDLKLREESLKISFDSRLYAITDGSHILIDDQSTKIYGEAYLIENGMITKINDNGVVLDIVLGRNDFKRYS